MKKYMIIAVTLMFTLSTFSLAARTTAKKVSYTKAKKSTLQLSSADVAIIDKAIQGRFSRLSNSDKDKLIAFLNDFKNNTSKDEKTNTAKTFSRGSSKKSSSGSAK
jgi:hypothetical protein